MKQDHLEDPRTDDERSLFTLARAFVAAHADLAHNTVRMAASESGIIVSRIARRLGMFVAGALLGAVGLLLALQGAADLLGRLTGLTPWAALLLLGVTAAAVGTILAVRSLRRLGAPDLAFPATLAEIQLDLSTLRRPAGGDRGDAQ